MPLLFSYGTLQQESVQVATFGRRLSGTPDELLGYAQELIKIEDPNVTAKSGRTHHPIVVHTGWQEDRVKGTVFEVTDEDLDRADAYEVDAYRRVIAPLASGLRAWVYVDALRGPAEGGSKE
jgi:gamma-glutamylcyclotransferase (GGCT)/AIG2-like uncharacterized protein YtfP